MVASAGEDIVILTRRTLLEAGAAGLAAAVARPALAQSYLTNTSYLRDTGIDPRLRARALAALAANRSRVGNADIIAIADFNRASKDPRFYLLDLRNGRVDSHLVAHGRGSDRDHIGWLQTFSNDYGSEATSRGAYVTGSYYTGKYGYSLRLKGLDATNSNAERRDLVIHSAWYAEPEVAAEYGKLGRSEGCFAFSAASHAEMMGRLGPGRFIYADKI